MIVTVVVWAFVISWLLLTIGNQFQGRASRWVRSVDLFNIVPRWTFFAPQPGRTDIHLLYRGMSDAHGHGQWREAYPVTIRSWWTVIRNPEKRRRKAIVDLANRLVQTASDGEDDPGRITIGIPYLAFLNFVSGLDDGHTSLEMRQFALVASEGPQSTAAPRVLARSGPHMVAEGLNHAA